MLIHYIFQTPRTPEEWKVVADGFSDRWQFPNCVGAVDGKHLRLKLPANSGINYHNYKGYASIVLLGVVDTDYKFLFVDVGSPGRCVDVGVWRDCAFNKVKYAKRTCPKINISIIKPK